MDQSLIEEKVRETYRATAARYRRADELHVTSEDYSRLCTLLGMFSSSFGRPIVALDLGCGTGRHFHCIRNAQKIVGLDVCQEMLDEARNPVRREEISGTEIELICANIYTAALPSQSFDFIYSIGVFGNGCGLTEELLSRAYDWLAPGGRIFFDVIEFGGLPLQLRIKTALRRWIPPTVRRKAQVVLQKEGGEQWPPLFLYSKREIDSLLRINGFFPMAVYPQECVLPAGSGSKLYCLAIKPRVVSTRVPCILTGT